MFQNGASVASNQRPYVVWLTAASQRFQIAKVANLRAFQLRSHSFIVSQWDEDPMTIVQCCVLLRML